MSNLQYSIVIPAYNEEARIGRTLDSVLACVDRRKWDAEVLVVDDGSRDGTAKIVESFAEGNAHLRLIRNASNRGKGFSVRNGMLQAQGRIALFTDADLSSPIDEAERLFAAIEEGADIAIGSRWLDRGRQTVHQPLYRQFFGRCFNAVTRMIMGLPFADTQCGFKAFRGDIVRDIFSPQRIERWGFDPELLFIAIHHGYKIREVPVTWGHDERTRISYLRDGSRMLQDLLYIRWNKLRGVYRRRVPQVTMTDLPASVAYRDKRD